MKARRTVATRGRKPAKKLTGHDLPPSLHLLLKLTEGDGITAKGRIWRMDKLCTALAAAREVIGAPRDLDTDPEHLISLYIEEDAKTEYPEMWRTLENEINGAPFVGEAHNAFAEPALSLGMALAYVLLKESTE